jgi:hypothetical protein
VNWALDEVAPVESKTSKLRAEVTGWTVPHVKSRLSSPRPRKLPAAAEEVVTVPVVVLSEAEPEQEFPPPVQLLMRRIGNGFEVADWMPGLVATRVYPRPT